jgi:hypothetical protein
MSLESWPDQKETRVMSYRGEKEGATDRGFSALHFRQAMGPGYQVAAFTDQPVITGLRPAGSGHRASHHS